MTKTIQGRRFRGSVSGLFLLGGLLVTAASPPTSTTVAAASALPSSQVGDDIDGEAAQDSSGFSVAMSSDGNTVVVGGHLNDGNGKRAGHARVYRLDGSAWVQVGGDIDGEAAVDESGFAVAISSDGNTVAIGAYLNDGNGDGSGHTRVHRFDGTDWVQVGSDIDGESRGDRSGWSVAMSGDGAAVIIGAPDNRSGGTFSGHARVFRFDGTDWVQVGRDLDGEGESGSFGRSVAISSDGGTIAVADRFNDGNGAEAGHVRVFRFDGSNWVQVGADLDGEAPDDRFGWSVALSGNGNTVAVGAPFHELPAGHARVFRLDGSAWVQVGADIDGDDRRENFGASVALSSDGDTVAVGASRDYHSNSDAGYARVFEFDGTSWIPLGGDLDGEAVGDGFGSSIAMSSDGSRIIVGAPWNDGGGDDAGHARVFDVGEPNDPVVLACGDTAGTVEELAAAGFNVVVGTADTDFLPGTPGNDFVLGLGGSDVILVGMGDDVVCAGDDHDVVVGGNGSDWLQGDGGNDRVWGGNGDDWIGGDTGKDLLVGGDGADLVFGGGASDTIRGGNDDDVLRGDAGPDDIRGDAGNDMLFGDSADDVLRGHAGVDVCDGGTPGFFGDQAFSCETLIDVP